MSFSADDHRYMARALQLAERGLYTTDPNPRVGCVLVRANAIIGEGWHERAGEAHAEVHALQAAGEQANGSTAYVTLEPCCHHGRTPPCSEALIQAGVSRVVVAMRDPHSQVDGGGISQLQAAGIAVDSGLMEAQARQLNPGFIRRMQRGRPYVRLKLAMSLDGRTAMASGESQWITGAAARQDVQHWRARSSAILTGVGTVLADDPSMTVRLEQAERQPLRVIVDTHLSTPANATILQQPGKTVIMTCSEEESVRDALRNAGAEVITVPEDAHNNVDLGAVLDQLGEMEINELHVETGATLAGALMQAGLVDELIIYMAPTLLGDAARGLFHLPGLENMADQLQLQIKDIRAIGEDWRITAEVRKN
ncbi:bifunctional diaminohydroxyphosphoribosylaminopyrimidine deaminase/5-amino-6-(5-phosphoribosylamino)uracil reductase RibD [Thiohalophilus sp.]|uniref:bifunctional diaminohydroxyphosphoribosylaminopyrimidine deaminase/5-amino-6-(5-phosphoribosylamino)uracil reductase RibD n=1 Tax=Thiohalophilus sp. TaxID=3028392 RepID=UPI002ACECDA0|nr:bifunctional diaminohydroxyphosphoribosylaminopyrimidine deaminase/5-amino-6-(5-phosphoribosylamino)uracil reductase RibD [Thiohalophilus sp.]MDZ7663433.1 bifunctional diaminohydroxyphosphoribosylaminopyrimidine deaminase/5-amino-6-(5-phosphoribosylamino)uracil reductase RibD [Thiohalophilus sp.]